MVSRTQRLPIASPPEQRLIATVWDDVVNHRGCCHTTLCLAHHAQGVGAQEPSPGLLPLVAVAALGSRLVTGAPAPGLHRGHAPGVEHWQR